jgi:hypothetical protein
VQRAAFFPTTPRWHGIHPIALAGLLRTLGYRNPTTPTWLRLTAVAVTVVLALVLSAGALAAASAVIGIVGPQPTSVPSVAPTAAPVAFEGLIEQLSQERWMVSGRVILLGRDDNKCDPKPHDDKPEHKPDDKKKEDKRPHK